MKELKKLCEYSHDYDGFMYVEEDCCCTLCKKGKKYILKQDMDERRDYESAGGSTKTVVLEGEVLDKTLDDLCISEWGKTYEIRKGDTVTMAEHIKAAEKTEQG